MKVRDYMSEGVFFANPEDGLRQTWDRMQERGIRHMPVLDDQEHIVGIISDRDLRRPGTLDVGGQADAFVLDNSMKVKEAMTGRPDTVRADDPLAAAVTLFVDKHYGALPVVGEQGEVLGMLSSVDLLRALQALLTKG